MSGWRPGVIVAQCDGDRKSLPGWISEPFGLDWGLHIDTGEVFWVVHHLPTGYNLFALRDDIAAAMRLVTLLRSLGDWSFTEVRGVHAFADTAAIVRAAGFDIWAPHRIGRPHYPDQVKEPA